MRAVTLKKVRSETILAFKSRIHRKFRQMPQERSVCILSLNDEKRSYRAGNSPVGPACALGFDQRKCDRWGRQTRLWHMGAVTLKGPITKPNRQV